MTLSVPDFRALFQVINAALLVLDHELRIVAFNAAYSKATGLSENDSVGRPVLEVFPPNPDGTSANGSDDLASSLERVLRTGLADEMSLMRYDLRNATTGEFEERFWKVVNTPVKDEAGRVTHILNRAEDITQFVQQQNRNLKLEISQEEVRALKLAHKEIEASSRRLRESESQLEFALESARMGAWRIDLRTNVATASKGVAKIWGVDEINVDIFELIDRHMHPDDRDRVNKVWTEAAKTHLPYDAEYRVIRPDGKMIWGLARGETQFDESGRPIALIGILSDITERKEAELRLEESRKQTELEAIRADRERAKFQAAFHAVAEGLFIFDSQGNPVFMNEGAARVFGAKSAAEVTQGFSFYFERLDLYDMNDVFIPLTEWPVARALRGESFRDWQIKAHRHDTGDRWVWSSSGELATQTGSDISLAVVTLRDITSQIKAQNELLAAKSEAERANQLKSAFLANMSHEIRTPLGAILGFSTLLKEKNLNTYERNQYVDTIVRNGNSLTRIIDDILDLAKVEAGKLDVESVPFSLYGLATDAVDLFKDKAKEKDIYLFLNIADTVPSRICSDPTRLRQILVNLIGNAVKFTSKGGVRVTIGCEMIDEEQARVTVDVKDTGIGLDIEQRERLFNPFMQADNSMTRKFGGTGLGLALSQRLSKALQGEVTISETALGTGSTFTLKFVAKRIASRSETDALIPASQSNALIGLRVLIVDDSPDNLFLASRILTKNGAHVETAVNGLEGSDKALLGDFDVVLMDIQMPVMDGFQAKRRLDEEGYTKPVLALTAHAMADQREKTLAAGFAGHLTKPIEKLELVRVVASVVD